MALAGPCRTKANNVCVCPCVCLQAFLPLALTAASRMLEPLLTNTETGRQFVERGGADVLLKLYQLPKLTVGSQATAYT